MLKLSCTMIVRDEASNLRACLESIRPHVDELVIVDTGSKDDTPAIARSLVDKFELWTDCNDSESRIRDFSAARNRALELATGDALCWFDGDDVVRGAEHLRKLVSEAHSATKGQPFSWLAPYEYERDDKGRVTTLQWRERIVYPRAGWEWRGPVHEGLLGKAGTVPTYMQTDLFTVQHQTGGTKPRERDRNLRILEAFVREQGETDPRALHYFAAELMLNGRIGEALMWFRRHNALAPWSDERCLSLMHLGRIHFAMGDFTEAMRWALEASTTKAWPEPHWLIGLCCFELYQRGIDKQHNLARAAHFLKRGFQIDKEDPKSLLMKDPTVRYDALANFASVLELLGRKAEALEAAEAALAGKPEFTHLAEGIKAMRREKLQGEIIAADQRGDVPHLSAVAMVKMLRGEVKIEQAPKKKFWEESRDHMVRVWDQLG
jgi:tetratricopeptide (TPR) repeat protein